MNKYTVISLKILERSAIFSTAPPKAGPFADGIISVAIIILFFAPAVKRFLKNAVGKTDGALRPAAVHAVEKHGSGALKIILTNQQCNEQCYQTRTALRLLRGAPLFPAIRHGTPHRGHGTHRRFDGVARKDRGRIDRKVRHERNIRNHRVHISSPSRRIPLPY